MENPLVEQIKKSITKFQYQKLCSSDEVCDAFLDLMLLAQQAHFDLTESEQAVPIAALCVNN